MKKNSFGFSILEVVVGTVLLALSVVSVMNAFSFLQKRDEMIETSVRNMYFNDYVFQIVDSLDIPEFPVGQKFYLNQEPSGALSISQNPSDSNGSLGFFVEAEGWRKKHEIEVLESKNYLNSKITQYKITTQLNENTKTSFVNK